MENNKWVVKWLVGALWGVIILALDTLTNNVIANEKKSTDGDKEITKEFQLADSKLREKIDANQEKLQEKMTTMLVQQTKILTILENKLND